MSADNQPMPDLGVTPMTPLEIAINERDKFEDLLKQALDFGHNIVDQRDELEAERDALREKVADLERLMFCWGGVRINGHILELFISDDDQCYILEHVWDEPDHHGNYVSNRIIDRSAQDFQFSKIYRDLIDAARAEAGTEAKSG